MVIVYYGGRPMMCPDQPDRQSVQKHRLVLLAAGVLVEEEKVLLASRVLMEKEMMLLGSEILDEVERMGLSCGNSAGSWCFWDPFSWLELDWAGGHRHPMFEHSWFLLIYQSAATENKIL
jgi:hypothetical protein